MNKIAIVIGATGLVGRALVDQLVEAKHIGKIVTLTRTPSPHHSAKVTNHVVDFATLAESADLLVGDLLFSCLGTTRQQAGSIAAQRIVDVDYQFEAAQLAVKNGVHHYLLVSSSGANALSNNAYLKMKGELEEQVKILPFERISLFQPSLLIGPRETLRLGERVGAWLLPLLCRLPGLRRYRPIKGQQVAAKMIRVSQASGESLESFLLDEIFSE